jgi:hypothetical protein
MSALSKKRMAKGRKGKDYREGPRKQMTIAWKLLVTKTLADNEKEKREPANLSQLSKMIPGSDKTGIYRTFSLELEPPQMSSVYVDDICALLKISPPLVEATSDAETERDVETFRALDAETRSLLLDPEIQALVRTVAKKRRS